MKGSNKLTVGLLLVIASMGLVSAAQANVFTELQEAREAESIGMTVEAYQRKKARRAMDSEVYRLRQNGVSAERAAVCAFNGYCPEPAPRIYIQPRRRMCSMNVVGNYTYRVCR